MDTIFYITHKDTIFCIINFLFVALLSLLPGELARQKGRGFAAYYFLSFLLTPFVTIIILLCLKPKEVFHTGAYTPPKEAWEKAKMPGGVRQCCEDFRGDSIKLKAFLDDAVQRDLIAQAQVSALYNEFMQPRPSSAAVVLSGSTPSAVPARAAAPNNQSADTEIGWTIRFCRKCGVELKGPYRFCPRCGVSIVDTPATGEEKGAAPAGDSTPDMES